jgi:dephospho-CoA kinase
MKIIAFTGMPFSGKSEAVKVAKRMKIPTVRMGDTVWEEVKKQGLVIVDENVAKVASDMRKKFGKEIWAKKTYEKVRLLENEEMIIIDGIRNIEEIDFFKSKLGENFLLVSVNCTDETRHQRAFSRNREDDSIEINRILKRDHRELDWGIDTVIKSADKTITNEGSIENLQKAIEDIILEFKNR